MSISPFSTIRFCFGLPNGRRATVSESGLLLYTRLVNVYDTYGHTDNKQKY